MKEVVKKSSMDISLSEEERISQQSLLKELKDMKKDKKYDGRDNRKK